jgi:hypothetical protein
MSSEPTWNRWGRYFVIVAFAVLPMLGILASLWPLEPLAVRLLCIVLALAVTAVLPFVRSLARVFVGITSIAVLLSLMTTNWPLYSAYRWSRPSFDRLATQVHAGIPAETPERVGLFRIERAEVNRNGVVCLWTNDDPSGPTGFVQHGPDNLPFNLWSHMPLDESWQFIKLD